MNIEPNATNPSPRHIWEVMGEHVDHCKRCGTNFHRKLDTRAAIYCAPRPQWLRDHPEDDRKQR